MLTVLPSAPPSSSSRYLASVGPWNESGGAVRLTKPLSSRPVISSEVDAGEISRTSSGIVTDSAVGIVSADAQAPAMQLAPSESTILRRPHRGLLVGAAAVVLGDQLDRVVGAGLLDGGVDLLEREVGGLVAGRTEVRQVAAEGNRIADHQIERGLASTSVPPPSPSSSSPQAARPSERPATTKRGNPDRTGAFPYKLLSRESDLRAALGPPCRRIPIRVARLAHTACRGWASRLR